MFSRSVGFFAPRARRETQPGQRHSAYFPEKMSSFLHTCLRCQSAQKIQRPIGAANAHSSYHRHH